MFFFVTFLSPRDILFAFRQGVIKLRNSGEFFIANEGKRAMFVDGRPVRILTRYKPI